MGGTQRGLKAAVVRTQQAKQVRGTVIDVLGRTCIVRFLGSLEKITAEISGPAPVVGQSVLCENNSGVWTIQVSSVDNGFVVPVTTATASGEAPDLETPLTVDFPVHGTAQYQIYTSGATPFEFVASDYFLRGTTGQTYTFPSTSATLPGLSLENTFTAAQTITDGATTPWSVTPKPPLYIAWTGASPSIFIEGIGNNIAPFISFLRSQTGRTAVLNNDVLGRIRWRPHDGVQQDTTQTEIRSIATQNHAVGAHGTNLSIWVTPNGSTTLTSVATFDSTGLTLPANGLYITGGTVEGDLLYGTSATGFGRLANPATNGRIPTSGLDGVSYPTPTVVWSDFTLYGTTGGTTRLAVTSGKTLTLTASDDYNITFTGSGTLALGGFTLTAIASGTVAMLGEQNVFTVPQRIGSYTSFAEMGIGGARTTMNHHAFEDWTVTTPSASALGYCSFDAKAEITGSTGNNSHFVGYQSRQIYSGAGDITVYWHDYDTGAIHNGAGTVALHRGMYITDLGGSGPVTSSIGLEIGSITRGSSNNQAIKVNGGKSYFGGIISINTTNTDTWLNVAGDAQLTGGKAWYAFSEGTFSATDARWANFYASSSAGVLFLTSGKGSYSASIHDMHFSKYDGTTLTSMGTFQASTSNFIFGIGTPAATVEILRSTAPTFRLSNTKDSAAWTQDEALSTIQFYTGDTSGARVAASIAHITDFAGSHGNPRGAIQFNVSTTGAVFEAGRFANSGDLSLKFNLDLASGKNITLVAGNIVTDTTTGSIVFSTSSQKGSFWGKTPIVQPAGAAQAAPAAYVTGAFGLDSNANMQALYDLVVAMRTALVNTGIMKGAA